MDLGSFLRVLSGAEVTTPGQSRDRAHVARVVNPSNLGPGVPWVFDDASSSFRGFEPNGPAEESAAQREKDLGNEAYKAGNYEVAVRHYTNAIHLDKDNATYYSNRCAAYTNLDRLDDALHDATKTIALKPEWAKGYSRKGAVLYKQGRYMLAAAAYSEGVALEPNNAELKKNLVKSELAYRRELTIDQVKVDVACQTCEVDVSNLGAVIRGNISMNEGGELLSRVMTLRADNLFYDPNADALAKVLANDLMVSTEFERQLRLNKESIQYPLFCKLQQKFYEQQDQLRGHALAGDPTAYHQTLHQRNDTEGELTRVATTSLHAYQDLAELEGKRSQYVRRCCEETVQCMQPLAQYCEQMLPRDEAPVALRSADGEGEDDVCARNLLQGRRLSICSATSPSAKRQRNEEKKNQLEYDTLGRELLKEYGDWKQTLMENVGKSVAATNAAAATFYQCLQQEEQALSENISLLRRGPGLLRRLMAFGGHTLETLRAEDVSVSLEHLRSQQADFEGAYTNLLNIAESRKQAKGLLEEETELERERLALEKKRIKVQAEADWLKVQGEDGEALNKATALVAEYKERISRVVTRQGEVEELVSDLAHSNQPELLWNAVAGGNSTKNRHLKWIKGSGAWMNRSLIDFDIKKLLGTSVYSKVFHATHYGHDCVLKEIPMQSEESRKLLLNEIKMVSQVCHPSIMKINGVFQDGPMAYIVMPYYPNGTIRKYLETNTVAPWVFQEMLRQIVSGVANLHEHRMIHRDLKPTNILMKETQPLISDFGIAKDTSAELGGTTGPGVKGTQDYLSPEVLAGNPHTMASDVWALGILVYELAALVHAKSESESADVGASPKIPVLMPGQSHISVPSGVLGCPRLADLVETILQKDPAQRPTAQQILVHPYFANSLLQDMSENHILVQSDQKLAAFSSFLQTLRSAQIRALRVSLDRTDIMGSMAQLMDTLGTEGIVNPLQISFRGERAIDEGGVTMEMYSLYFSKCVARDRRLLVCSETEEEPQAPAEGGGATPTDDVVVGAFYLPNARKKGPQDLKAFNVFGRVLLKSLMDNAPCPFQPSLSLLKYLLGVDVGLSDLEQYDKVFAHQLRDLLITKGDVSEMGLDFSELMEGGEDVLVTNENKVEYVNKKVQHILIGQRKEQLEQIKTGFYCNPTLTPHLRLLSPMELMIAMCGSQHIKAELLVKQLAFRGFPVASNTPKMLIEFVQEMTQNNLRRFLRLITASCVLPYRGLQRHISVVCVPNSEALPVGHTCSVQLDLPDYNDFKKLKQKMGLALAHVDDPFGYA